MCGITGFISFDLDNESIKKTIISMSKKLIHRGPDDDGLWIDYEVGIALSHRRLAIVDLSSAGHQPMFSICKRFCIILNGEIYNHISIRKQLPKSLKWKGHSDTETIINAIAHWGIQKTLEKIVGMYAFALWDRKERKLTLARDRMGEKPLYYGFSNSSLLFSSELKALNAFPSFSAEIDKTILGTYLRFGNIPAPYSIYKEIYKLEPGMYLEFHMNDISKKSIPKPTNYWDINSIAYERKINPFVSSDSDAIEFLDLLLKKTISEQLLGDVPIGAFLSGGIDSSSIVSIMQNLSSNPIKTFTVGFNEHDYDESFKARSIANYLGTSHNEIIFSSNDALQIIPKIPTIYDEPFADESQIPTTLISEFSSRSVKVCLSGDGGDELFCGYNRYLAGPKIWKLIKILPPILRKFISRFIYYFPISSWDNFYKFFKAVIPNYLQINNPGIKIHKISNILNAETIYELYLCVISSWQDSNEILIDKRDKFNQAQFLFTSKEKMDLQHQMMLMDAKGYLPNDILVKTDRASMSSSLETRMPMLNHKLIEFAWSIPLSMKMRGNRSKWILRQVLNKYLPKKIYQGPKSGFAVPIGDWLRGPLREWAEDLIDPNLIYSQNFFHSEHINKKWKEHISGKRDWSSQLWTILMFQSWLIENKKNNY